VGRSRLRCGAVQTRRHCIEAVAACCFSFGAKHKDCGDGGDPREHPQQRRVAERSGVHEGRHADSGYAWRLACEFPSLQSRSGQGRLDRRGADAQSEPLTRELRAYGRRQPGCRALMAHYGIGALTAVTILAELGDARRVSSSRLAVRYAGLDIIVHQSDQRRAPGHLSRQGPPALRWALYEAAQLSRRAGPRPRRLRASGRATRRQPRVPRRGSQAAQAQLLHAGRTRRRGPGARRLTPTGARAALTDTDAPRPAPRMLQPPPSRPRSRRRSRRWPRLPPARRQTSSPRRSRSAARRRRSSASRFAWWSRRPARTCGRRCRGRCRCRARQRPTS
jgi:hypothetical protein